MIRRPPRSTHCISSAASDVYKRQIWGVLGTAWWYFLGMSFEALDYQGDY